MQHMTPRELVRRWYGQINNQPPEVRQQLTKMVAHTVIPAAAMQQFGPSDYAPLSGCIDIVLHSEINTVGESIGTTIRGYRSSYDVGFNELKIGGVNNLLFVRDLSQRPHSEGKQRVINPDKESAVLLAALEMDAEREAALRAPRLQQRPEWAGALLAYPNDQAPKFEITEGVKLTALHYMSDNAPPLKALCAPQGYRGYLKRIIRHSTYGITMIELSKENDNFNDMDLVFEVPSWAQLLVEPRQDVVGGMPLAALTLPEDMLNSMTEADYSVEAIWSVVSEFVGKEDIKKITRMIWESEVSKNSVLTMIPSHLLSGDYGKPCSVWRDLRGKLGRTCHLHRNASRIIRSGPREGKISVWSTDHPLKTELKQNTIFGSVDLFSTPDKLEPCSMAAFSPSVAKAA
jgi:hypothetical protein